MSLLPRRALLGAIVAVVALLSVPSAASPAEQIIIYGAKSGSHLALFKRGDRVIVKGNMAKDVHPQGCRLGKYALRAVCPTEGVGTIEIRMGPSNDFVEVHGKLPATTIVHLGDGSDKFVGGGEVDYCYPEGARRNRCIGGPGNDVCITGKRNSDCVGGPGNDYCRHYNGSDGCWGGPGNDVCVMGPGRDGCHGGPGNDRLYGGRAPDRLYGGPGRDYCDGQQGWGKSQGCEAGPRR
ncbi:MAG: calcium-binding protein [Solirubrobacterales bacterium]